MDIKFRWRNWLKSKGLPNKITHKLAYDRYKWKLMFASYGGDFTVNFVRRTFEWWEESK